MTQEHLLPDCCGALQFTEAVVNLKFDEEPKYAAYSALFEPLCGTPAARPVLQTDAPKVQHALQDKHFLARL